MVNGGPVDAIGKVKEPGEVIDEDQATTRDEGDRGEGDGRPEPGEVG